jgi:hypothetical protein
MVITAKMSLNKYGATPLTRSVSDPSPLYDQAAH